MPQKPQIRFLKDFAEEGTKTICDANLFSSRKKETWRGIVFIKPLDLTFILIRLIAVVLNRGAAAHKGAVR